MSKAAELANLIGNINAGGGGVNRNLIINGNFVVAQRGTSFSNVTSSQFCLDRFSVDVSGGGAFNVTQDTSAPEGFEKSLKLEVNTADSSIAAADAYRVTQAVEGQNISQADLGASTAKAMALSFYVKSSVTGTYGVGLANNAETENFVAEYTISSANTWEKKTINIPVRTSGTWLTDNSVGIGVRFDLGSGTNYNGTAGQWQTTSSKVYRTSSCVNLIATGSATWFLTGVQLEIGQNPTSFEFEPFERTMIKCKRYFQIIGPHNTQDFSIGIEGFTYSTTATGVGKTMAIPMRIGAATVAMPDGNFRVRASDNTSTVEDITGITLVRGCDTDGMFMNITHGSITNNTLTTVVNGNANRTMTFDAEL